MRVVLRILISAVVYVTLTMSSAVADQETLESSMDLLNRGDDLISADSVDQALEAYIEAAEKADSEGNSSVLTEAYSQVARCYLKKEQKDAGRPWLEKAEKIASKDDSLGWSRYLSVRGRYEWKDAAERAGEITPETDKASATFKQMYDYCMEQGLNARAIDAANMISLTGRKSERIEWAQKGIEAAEKGNLDSWLAPLWNNLGWAYDDEGRYEESLQALEEARKYHYKSGDELSMLIADWSVAHALRMTGQIPEAEKLLRKVQKLSLIRRSENNTPENCEWVGFVHLELGEISLLKGFKSDALNFFKIAYRNLSDAGMKEWDPKKLEEVRAKMKELSSQK